MRIQLLVGVMPLAHTSAFEQALRQRPKNGRALFGIARSYALARDEVNATRAYHEFLTSWLHADADLSQIKQANSWLARHAQ